MQTYLYIFLAILLVSLISLIGVSFLALSKKKLDKIVLFLVSFSAGSLLGGGLIHLMPEAVHEASARGDESLSVWLYLVFGLITFFILEKVIHWRHCHINTCDEHPHHLGKMNLIGDLFHNFFDGVIIAGAFLINLPLGVATLIAVIAHEIPQEIADFGVLIYAGYSKKKALLMNFVTALSAFLGAFLAIIFASRVENFSEFIIPFTAGGFVYIASADLLPELKKETGIKKSLFQLIAILIGLALMVFLKLFFEHSH